ncbi:hypothetical protein GCM10011583_53150 [Streptomyces camponoticapitis]|uniref:Uncharacterized protein n=1 Tax=Streptomyces camponoticapitis TaxID=1616125 RepID=A0ABQ2EMG9_9ACTN|nr:hypothetical protein [Streptomyces camponoticapitis]GGK14561.1 hypothetical protein GCM10011583_53150 [Streptomyces camponoticapitis]
MSILTHHEARVTPALTTIPAPPVDRYAPGTPWSTHTWTDDAYWGDSCSFCAVCDAVSFKGEAHQVCPGRVVEFNPLSRALLVKPKENV